jgi:hypothetical protein
VYQYFYEGQRQYEAGTDNGTEFVFNISADRKNWDMLSVLVSETAVRAWETANGRELSRTEWYAIAKIALFQAFDERASPSLMSEPVKVRTADIDAIVETLGL